MKTCNECLHKKVCARHRSQGAFPVGAFESVFLGRLGSEFAGFREKTMDLFFELSSQELANTCTDCLKPPAHPRS